MFFKLTQEINEHFGRKEHSPWIFEFRDPDVVVKYSALTEADIENNLPKIKCEVTTQKLPNESVVSIFSELKDDIYVDSAKADTLTKELQQRMKSGEISGYSLPYDIIPSKFHDFSRNITNLLSSYSSRTYKTIRWIDNILGDNNPFHSNSYKWSFDNKEWYDFPPKIIGKLQMHGGLFVTENHSECVRNIVQNGDSEPLGHELLREAEALCESYPRSSLLIGVTAAETGIKQCITTLQPETKWLMENMPSPDILKLIRDYLPLLPVKNNIEGSVVIPKLNLLDPLKKVIHMRNIVAHGGTCSITTENLTNAFDTIRNMLYLLDYYSGYEWAMKNVSEECKLELCIK